ncbi:MAG: GAF domain-containing protein [Deltaproteobacteria bacterium]|nr:GAF domain-containing protein [Deltaproteobacteria bacterium]
MEERYRELEKKYREKCHQIDLMKQIQFITTTDFNLDSFLERIIDRVLNLTETVSAALLLLDDSDGSLIFAVVRGPGSDALKGRVISGVDGIAGKVLSTGQSYISQDTANDPTWDSSVAESINYRTNNLIAAPLIMGGKSIGVIEIINKKDGQPFVQNDLAHLESISSEVALTVENARLLAKASQQSRNLKTLSQLSSILNSNLDHNYVRKSAIEAVIELLRCETGSLYLIDVETNELYFDVALGDQGEKIKTSRLKMGEGVAGWVALHGKSDLVADTSTDLRWSRRQDEKTSFATRNMITVPVKIKDEIIGVLQAINKLGENNPSHDDLTLLEQLADQVAIALENARLYKEQKIMFKKTAEAIVTAIEKRDPYTGMHTKRVRDFSMTTAEYLDLSSEAKEWLELAAILHDTGKIGIDDQVLRKPSKLTESEFDSIKQHPDHGTEILRHIKELGPAIPGMKGHHERYDGGGYPSGVKGTDIPLIARIISVADTFDAMTSDRPYRKGMERQVALDEIKNQAGRQFDPNVVEAFLKADQNGEITI